MEIQQMEIQKEVKQSISHVMRIIFSSIEGEYRTLKHLIAEGDLEVNNAEKKNAKIIVGLLEPYFKMKEEL